MNDFELKYGDADDYLGTQKLLDFRVVRKKNYNTIIDKTNRRMNKSFSMCMKSNDDQGTFGNISTCGDRTCDKTIDRTIDRTF